MKPADVHIHIARLTCHAVDASAAQRLPRRDPQRLGSDIAARIEGRSQPHPIDPLSAAIATALRAALATHLGEYPGESAGDSTGAGAR